MCVCIAVEAKEEPQQLSKLSDEQKRRIRQLENGTLLLNRVQEADPRKYLCFIKPSVEAQSNLNNVSSTLNLDVKIPAQVTAPEGVETRHRHAEFNVTCNVRGEREKREVAWQFRKPTWDDWAILAPESHSFASLCSLLPLEQSFSDVSCKSSRLHDRRRPTEQLTQFTVVSQVKRCHVHFFTELSQKEFELKLEILYAGDEHIGEYRCVSRNVYNAPAMPGDIRLGDSDNGPRWTAKSFNLSVVGPPSYPRVNETRTSTDANSIHFWWAPPLDNGHLPILRYIVSYNENSDAKSMVTVEIDKDSVSHQITDLWPFTHYTFTIRAINSAGPGEKYTFYATTDQTKPAKGVEDLACRTTAFDSIEVSWTPVPKRMAHGPIQRHWICWKHVSSVVDKDQMQVAWPSDLSEEQMQSSGSKLSRFDDVLCLTTSNQTTMLTLPGLDAFTYYAVRVIAQNPQVPTGAPTDLGCFRRADTSLEMRWNAPEKRSLNGVLRGYQLFYHPVHDSLLSNESSITLAANHELNYLTPDTNYSISVFVLNDRGRGPASKAAYCRTSIAQSSPPRSAKAVPFHDEAGTSSCVLTSWLPPEQPNGPLEGYYLQLVDSSEFSLDLLSRLRGEPVLDAALSHRLETLSYPRRFKGATVRSLFGYETWKICDLDRSKSYRLIIRAFRSPHQTSFPAVSSEFSLSSSDKIVSVGSANKVRIGTSLLLDCQTTGSVIATWASRPQSILAGSDYEILANNSLYIASAGIAHTGDYDCQIDDTSERVTYSIQVQNPFSIPPKILGLVSGRDSMQVSWAVADAQSDLLSQFELRWTDQAHSETNSVSLMASDRSYLIDRLKCGSSYSIELVVSGREGLHAYTQFERRTLGEKPMLRGLEPETSLVFVPAHASSFALFNLSGLIRGRECPPSEYQLQIRTPEGRSVIATPGRVKREAFSQLVFQEVFTPDDLISIDSTRPLQRFYKNVSNLHAASHYQYELTAKNAAGSFSNEGSFRTNIPTNPSE
ncbi:hypothetical protein Ciccas_006848 [Cichlidogyrus casuarinus]|uniref:Uncharacterized protein n=1 Tax=Cichlidogyrus casuarinus TaxID=1844966 RepID=A0ABD2Q569_9PLAT